MRRVWPGRPPPSTGRGPDPGGPDSVGQVQAVGGLAHLGGRALLLDPAVDHDGGVVGHAEGGGDELLHQHDGHPLPGERAAPARRALRRSAGRGPSTARRGRAPGAGSPGPARWRASAARRPTWCRPKPAAALLQHGEGRIGLLLHVLDGDAAAVGPDPQVLAGTHRFGKMPRPSGTAEMPSRASRSLVVFPIGVSPIRISPSVGRIRPLSTLRRVDLPAPLGPSRANTLRPAPRDRPRGGPRSGRRRHAPPAPSRSAGAPWSSPRRRWSSWCRHSCLGHLVVVPSVGSRSPVASRPASADPPSSGRSKASAALSASVSVTAPR